MRVAHRFVLAAAAAVSVTSFGGDLRAATPTSAAEAKSSQDWRREVVYQIYPRSFADGDGDGIGDLKGILGRVDYLQELGVDTVWLCPVNRTTNYDNGYDVSDYLDIDPTFGTLDDWLALRDALHQRGIKIMMDLVLNHTSDKHPWFTQEVQYRALVHQLSPAHAPPDWQEDISALIAGHLAGANASAAAGGLPGVPAANFPAAAGSASQATKPAGLPPAVASEAASRPGRPEPAPGSPPPAAAVPVVGPGPGTLPAAQAAPAAAAPASPRAPELVAAAQALEDFVRSGQAAAALGYYSVAEQLTHLQNQVFGRPGAGAQATRQNHDFFIWRDRPNNWTSIFSGSTWHRVPEAQAHYLALFSMHQPDLNWHNPRVRRAMGDIVKTWMARGVDGFRLDSVGFVGKNQRFPDASADDRARNGRGMHFFLNQPQVHSYLRELTAYAHSGAPMRTVGEVSFSPVEEALLYAGKGRHELSEVFLFDHMYVDMGRDKWDPRPFRLPVFKGIITHQQQSLHQRAWLANYLENHDQLRAVSRFGDDGHYRVESAKMLGTLLFTLEGTPYIYQGQEIGMTNGSVTHIEEVDDIEARNYYTAAVQAGEPADKVMRAVAARTRDNVRTVMQWDDSAYAGFSAHAPWIRANSNYPSVNVKNARQDPGSVLAYYKQLIKMRKETPVWVTGTFEDLMPEDPHLFVYSRSLGDKKVLITLNFSGESRSLPEDIMQQLGPHPSIMLGNYPTHHAQHRPTKLSAWEARVWGNSAVFAP